MLRLLAGSREIEDAIGKGRFSRGRATVTAEDGSEAYAYPKPEGRIAWGVNAAETGVNILREDNRCDCAESARSRLGMMQRPISASA